MGKVTYSVLEQFGGLVIVFSLCKCCRSSLAIMFGKGGSPEIRNNEVKSFRQLNQFGYFFSIEAEPNYNHAAVVFSLNKNDFYNIE